MENTDMKAAPDIMRVFDSFCHKVIENAAADYRRRKDKIDRQILVPDFWDVNLHRQPVVDTYLPGAIVYTVEGYSIPVQNPDLQHALEQLSEQSRNIVLLYYYVGLKDRMIGEALSMDTRNVNHARNRAIKLLKEHMDD